MARRKDAFDNLFNCFVKEGRELGYLEARRLYPAEFSALRKVSGIHNYRATFRRMKKIYADRWHEIYKVNLVQEKPEEVSEPILSPLERLRMESTRKKYE